jgi:hypothetical protein
LSQNRRALLEAVGGIVEQWPQLPNPVAGHSLSGLMSERLVVPTAVSSTREVLRRLFRQVGASQGRGRAHAALRDDTWTVSTPLPVPDRRHSVLQALGRPPLLRNSQLTAPRSLPVGERVHVYLDVSGSIGNLIGPLYAAVLDCQAYVHPTVHLFSTEVVEVTLEKLRRGVCSTTGGTNIECVARHVRAHYLKRAVLITDGFTGTPQGSDAEALAAATLGVALTPGPATRESLDSVTDFWAQLPPVQVGGNR